MTERIYESAAVYGAGLIFAAKVAYHENFEDFLLYCSENGLDWEYEIEN